MPSSTNLTSPPQPLLPSLPLLPLLTDLPQANILLLRPTRRRHLTAFRSQRRAQATRQVCSALDLLPSYSLPSFPGYGSTGPTPVYGTPATPTTYVSTAGVYASVNPPRSATPGLPGQGYYHTATATPSYPPSATAYLTTTPLYPPNSSAAQNVYASTPVQTTRYGAAQPAPVTTAYNPTTNPFASAPLPSATTVSTTPHAGYPPGYSPTSTPSVAAYSTAQPPRTSTPVPFSVAPQQRPVTPQVTVTSAGLNYPTMPAVTPTPPSGTPGSSPSSSTSQPSTPLYATSTPPPISPNNPFLTAAGAGGAAAHPNLTQIQLMTTDALEKRKTWADFKKREEMQYADEEAKRQAMMTQKLREKEAELKRSEIERADLERKEIEMRRRREEDQRKQEEMQKKLQEIDALNRQAEAEQRDLEERRQKELLARKALEDEERQKREARQKELEERQKAEELQRAERKRVHQSFYASILGTVKLIVTNANRILTLFMDSFEDLKDPASFASSFYRVLSSILSESHSFPPGRAAQPGGYARQGAQHAWRQRVAARRRPPPLHRAQVSIRRAKSSEVDRPCQVRLFIAHPSSLIFRHLAAPEQASLTSTERNDQLRQAVLTVSYSIKILANELEAQKLAAAASALNLDAAQAAVLVEMPQTV